MYYQLLFPYVLTEKTKEQKKTFKIFQTGTLKQVVKQSKLKLKNNV